MFLLKAWRGLVVSLSLTMRGDSLSCGSMVVVKVGVGIINYTLDKSNL